MKLLDFSNMTGGWFVGDFAPTAFHSKDFEVAFKIHKKDEVWDTHYHKQATEINLLVRGKMRIQDQEINAGQIFIMYPWEIADPIFLEDCELVIVKTPSVVGDKFNIEEKT